MKKQRQINYSAFKDRLWARIVRKSQPERERVFLDIARKRTSDGQFYIEVPTPNIATANLLVADGILGYELGGYFIAHDIYEEWALERMIEISFVKRDKFQSFFDEIGDALPVRRSFRSWISEKLFLKDDEVWAFIEGALVGDGVKAFWRDELLVSVLLSEYAESYFEKFRDILLGDNFVTLKRITFIVRIACKEIDENLCKYLGKDGLGLDSLKYVLTTPKGNGWKSLIQFLNNNFEEIGVSGANYVIPVLHDWNLKIKSGDTTRLAGLTALMYYQAFEFDAETYLGRDLEKKIVETIAYGALEIKEELTSLFNEVQLNGWKQSGDPYYHLCSTILTQLEGYVVLKALPEKVLELAELYWIKTAGTDRVYRGQSINIEEHFGLANNSMEFHPSSAYQTPIYNLLTHSFEKTIDFILRIVNSTLESFQNSSMGKSELKEIVLVFENGTEVVQYISDRIWCMYRGTQVGPHVLESIHMALEKYLLKIGKHLKSEILESWLLYLIRNSKSSSLTAVVCSIVLAYPDKTFSVAKILFGVKSLFTYDRHRLTGDQQHKGQLTMLRDSFGSMPDKRMHENERLDACDDKHRKVSLEELFLTFQFFRSESVTESEAETRKEALWKILDSYYELLPSLDQQSEEDKAWRIALEARMDGRKMSPTTEETDDGIVINWNPKMDPELKEYSETSLEAISERMKYSSLRMWASYKFDYNSKASEIVEYENDPSKAFAEAKEILSELENGDENAEINSMYFNRSIPAYVCCILIRDYQEILDKEDFVFCRNVLMGFASKSLDSGYQYQISDGVKQSISSLPRLFELFPQDRSDIKIILLYTLFNESGINWGGDKFQAFAIFAIHEFWKIDPDEAISFFVGYSLLKTKYDSYCDTFRKEKYDKGIYELDRNELLEGFEAAERDLLNEFVENRIPIERFSEHKITSLATLGTAFVLISNDIEDRAVKDAVLILITVFFEQILKVEHARDVDYSVRREFLRKYAYYVLSVSDPIEDLLKPVISNFEGSEIIAEMLNEFVSAVDGIEDVTRFWEIWIILKVKIVNLCAKGDGYAYIDKVVESYLFSGTSWKDSCSEWRVFRPSSPVFFAEIARDIGFCHSVFYSLLSLLTGIGRCYEDEGVQWLYSCVSQSEVGKDYRKNEITVYMLEEYARKYVYRNREKIRKSVELKGKLLLILDYMIERGSVSGYLLRESIL